MIGKAFFDKIDDCWILQQCKTWYDRFGAREFLQSILPLNLSRHLIPWTMISEGRLIQDTGRSSPAIKRDARSLASLFSEIAFGGHRRKEREDNVVRSDFFRGENVIREYLVARDTTKWFRYLANEGERNKFRATRRPASVIGWRCTKIIPEIWMWLLNVLAQVKLRFNFETKFIIDRIKLLVRMPRSKI